YVRWFCACAGGSARTTQTNLNSKVWSPQATRLYEDIAPTVVTIEDFSLPRPLKCELRILQPQAAKSATHKKHLRTAAGSEESRREKVSITMTTTTPSTQNAPADDNSVVPATVRSVQGWLLILLVFVSGACSLAVELSASRLLAPYFGTSLFVWANLIGLILLYLTIGYYLGGRLADRYPRPTVLYLLTTSAAFLIGLIPFISRPILGWSLSSFASYSISVFYGSLVSVILLFAIPMILLGCVSPFAIRLTIERVGKSGRTAGQLYAISTAGSILGTFLPVLWLIPTIGTYRTFFV